MEKGKGVFDSFSSSPYTAVPSTIEIRGVILPGVPTGSAVIPA